MRDVHTPTVTQEKQPTQRPDNVEIAKPCHEQEIFDMLILLWEENALFPRDDDMVMHNIRRATEGKGGIIGMIRIEGKIVGIIGMFLDSYWYSSTLYLSEYWNFVHPDYRRSEYAKNLIQFAKNCNENLGVMLIAGVLSTRRTAAKSRLLGRQLIPVGQLFANGLPSATGPQVRDMKDESDYLREAV